MCLYFFIFYFTVFVFNEKHLFREYRAMRSNKSYNPNSLENINCKHDCSYECGCICRFPKSSTPECNCSLLKQNNNENTTTVGFYLCLNKQ